MDDLPGWRVRPDAVCTARTPGRRGDHRGGSRRRPRQLLGGLQVPQEPEDSRTPQTHEDREPEGGRGGEPEEM